MMMMMERKIMGAIVMASSAAPASWPTAILCLDCQSRRILRWSIHLDFSETAFDDF